MLTTIEYTCKFCKQNRTFECDIDDNCPPLDMEKWKKALACNFCADYETERRSVERKIRAQAIALSQVRDCVKKADRLRELEEKTRDNLNALTKQFCRIVCKRFRRTNEWESMLTDTIMAQPQNWYDPLRRFLKIAGTVMTQ